MARHVSNASALGIEWIKAGASNPSGECVELGKLPGGDIAIRNSRFPDGPASIFSRQALEELLDGARCGEFDHLVDDDQSITVTGNGLVIHGEGSPESGPG